MAVGDGTAQHGIASSAQKQGRRLQDAVKAPRLPLYQQGRLPRCSCDVFEERIVLLRRQQTQAAGLEALYATLSFTILLSAL